MKITYDREADAAYIYFIDNREIREGWVKKTYPCDPAQVDGMINLDFDAEGKLGGIEILNAHAKLSKELLNAAEKISMD